MNRSFENAIDLEILPELTEADLEELGVVLGHRKRMLRAIAVLTRAFQRSRRPLRVPKAPSGASFGNVLRSSRLDPERYR